MEFADEKFKISRIINAEKDEEIIQKAPDSVSDEVRERELLSTGRTSLALPLQIFEKRICGSTVWVYECKSAIIWILLSFLLTSPKEQMIWSDKLASAPASQLRADLTCKVTNTKKNWG